MSAIVHFSPDLATWLVGELDRGQTPSAVLRTMIAEKMEDHVARAIVRAFVSARSTGRAVPVDSIVLDDEGPPYEAAPPRLRSGSRLTTADRDIQVLARGETPVLAVLGGVLAAEECAQIIALARPRLRASTVVDPATGRDVVASHRTSLGMFFRLGESELVARLDRRVSEVMGAPVENGEGFQVLCYPPGATTAPHFDFLIPSNAANEASIARSGQRTSTLVVYLNEVESGGETVFPEAGWSVVPQVGGGVYFEYANRRGQVDPRSLHAGNPATSGEKWILTKWMRERRFVSADASSPDPAARGEEPVHWD